MVSDKFLCFLCSLAFLDKSHIFDRCGIPVIIMGETGCGKTRLIRFMCDLQKPAGAEVDNMILMKVKQLNAPPPPQYCPILAVNQTTLLRETTNDVEALYVSTMLHSCFGLTMKPIRVFVCLNCTKVHGGTTKADIQKKVDTAVNRARTNQMKVPGIFTVLFFDEANTTEAIEMIKEILCDYTMGGKPSPRFDGLKFIAACNPYRK